MARDVPTDDELRPSGSLPIALGLAAVAGFTDAHLFLHVAQVFVANQSGNIVLFGMAAGQKQGAAVAGSGIAIVAFIAGIALATLFHDRLRERGRQLRPDVLLVFEMVVFAVMIGLTFGASVPTAGEATARSLPVLAAGAIAMGMQTAVLRRVGAIPVSTTYESGGIARMGEESVLATDRNRDAGDRAGRQRVLAVLGFLIASYAGGAAVAAALGESTALLFIPLATLAVIAVALRLGRP